ncbi:MAG: sigma-70 family RNA polymerase sigma factor [Myxococcota bacterium]
MSGLAPADLYGLHGRYVASLARRFGPAEDAADLTQEVFLHALLGWQRLRDPSRTKAWLRGITLHLAARSFRRRRLRGTVPISAELESQGPSPSEAVFVSEVEAVLATLHPRARAAWVASRLHGTSMPEIAIQLRCSVPTIKRAIAEAQRALTGRVVIE